MNQEQGNLYFKDGEFMVKGFMKKHGLKLIVPLYMIFYLASFHWLEQRQTYGFHEIYSSFDSAIPFCEVFIIPYVLWFFYIAATVIWFMFKNDDRKEYMQLILSLGIGMTLFLFISWVYPNIHFLRPEAFPRENIFTDWVRMLYSVDTPTNILPSIHVYNSVAAWIAISRCKALKKHRFVVSGSFVLTVLIVLSTMFLKQHTVVDVISAFILNFTVYMFVYRLADNRVTVTRNEFEY